MSQSQVRTYAAQARSTDTFGRVLCTARNHHFVVDGPVQNGCPGEAVNPGELFLAGVAACGVELVQVIAKERQVTPSAIAVDIEGMMDRSRPVRPDVSLFNSVALRFRLSGVTQAQAEDLIDRFRAR
ncbi:MAG TPA: OsmC family protein [Burkholderiales bacterium]|nr:OsmC family protein [Burkholderiales bacterium]